MQSARLVVVPSQLFALIALAACASGAPSRGVDHPPDANGRVDLPPSDRPQPSTSAVPPAKFVPEGSWPLPDSCTSPTRCTMDDDGGIGVMCEDDSPCVNPCPSGMAPNDAGLYCDHLCKSDDECKGGKCTDEGLCEGFPVFGCSHVLDCQLPDGHLGAQCKKSDPCVNPCKPGLYQAENGDCAKPCTAAGDCPAGECSRGYCRPTCPSEKCPYRWD
jgi:hypothetical protein